MSLIKDVYFGSSTGKRNFSPGGTFWFIPDEVSPLQYIERLLLVTEDLLYDYIITEDEFFIEIE